MKAVGWFWVFLWCLFHAYNLIRWPELILETYLMRDSVWPELYLFNVMAIISVIWAFRRSKIDEKN